MKKEENEKKLHDRKDTEVLENPDRMIRSFKVNALILGELLRIARKKIWKLKQQPTKHFECLLKNSIKMVNSYNGYFKSSIRFYKSKIEKILTWLNDIND